jgi:hypothetical protein
VKSDIDIYGRQVSFELQYDDGPPGNAGLQPASTVQVGMLVAGAIASALHYPAAVVIHAITMVVARTVTNISVELVDERNRKQIQLHFVTARMYSDSLLALSRDNSWDPGIKAHLEESLRKDFAKQLKRIRGPYD